MAAKVKSPRERAARAFCRYMGNPENITYQGRPMWMSYLDEVDVVLEAALDEAAWQAVRALGPDI
jgi:hypothetical protein